MLNKQFPWFHQNPHDQPQGFQNDMILGIVHRKYGLHLFEDEDFVYLVKDDHTVAAFFNSRLLTIKEIHDTADKLVFEGFIHGNNV